MLQAPSARIQARRECKATEDAASHQVIQWNRGKQHNKERNQNNVERNNGDVNAQDNQSVGINENGRVIRRRIEREEIEQEGIRHDEVGNEIEDENKIGEVNDDINLEEDKDQDEQELSELPVNDLVAIMAKQTRLLQALAQDRHSNNGKIHGIEGRLSEFLKFKPSTFDST